ncbi:MAG: arginine--tRNA ligase [Phycisphaerae bacterium]|nr:arginine--tRNA ligase [Phycisphaerae bacterium]
MSGAEFDPLVILHARFTEAIAAAFPDRAGTDPLITPGRNPRFGDFQCNAAMSLAKATGRPPREVAKDILGRLDLADLAEPMGEGAIAGPGFINVTLRPAALSGLLSALDSPSLGVPEPSPRQTVVVDLCGVNISKQMHVGHLRATVIGDALARTLERIGHRVIRQNHVGDWGLPIAMVVARLTAQEAAGVIDLTRVSLDELDRAYKAAQAECARDAAGLAAARRWGMGPKVLAELEEHVAGAEVAYARAKETLVRLQRGEPEAGRVWKRVADVTMAEVVRTCERLHAKVRTEDSASESSFAAELAGIVEDLSARCIAEVSEGALVVRCEGIPEPLLVRKSDGGYLYATTDLAAIRRRVGTLGADRIVYAVDVRQSLHFKQVFAASVRAGYARRRGGGDAVLEHAAFGMMLGEDGRPFKTRSGENVKLTDLIDEATERALRTVREKNPGLGEDERRTIAEVVAVAALKYADLSTERSKDYVFSFERMLAFEGNTGPYLLYALVRIRSIFRKAAERFGEGGADAGGAFGIATPAEKWLALTLLRFPGVLAAVGRWLEPHRMCQYLFDLAGAFATFFDACPVLQAEDEVTRRARLRLCRLTERVLSDGLGSLGIPTLDRM